MCLPRARMVALAICMGVFMVLACDGGRSDRAWRVAETAHREGVNSRAFRLWSALDPRDPRGREARERLRLADAQYRLAMDLFRAGRPGVREAVQAGIALGPMDPRHYLGFARLCAEHGVTLRAVDFYRKYLAQDPPPADAATARAELLALDGGVDPFPAAHVAVPEESAGRMLLGSFGLGGLALTLVFAGYRRKRTRRRRLSVLLPDRPEWHPTVAYHLGCLRHEFLKHRVGPLGEPLRAWRAGRASEGEVRFLRERLSSGHDLSRAWRSHLEPLERALGLAFQVDEVDPLFAGARRAVRRFNVRSWPPRRSMTAKLLKAHDTLMEVDARIARVLASLVRCRVDEALLWDVVTLTRSEWAMEQVALDEVRVGPVPEGVEVEVFRTDLFIVLRNLVRNAIAAMDGMPHPRRLGVDVSIELVPTGEELVRFRVQDTSPKEFPRGDTSAVDRGLGLVAAALRRYDGSMRIEPGDEGYAKAVAVRVFRSQWARDAGGGA